MTRLPDFLDRFSFEDLQAILRHFGMQQQKEKASSKSSLLDWEDAELLLALRQLLSLAGLLAHDALDLSSGDYQITINGKPAGKLDPEDFAWMNEWGGDHILSIIAVFNLHGLREIMRKYDPADFLLKPGFQG